MLRHDGAPPLARASFARMRAEASAGPMVVHEAELEAVGTLVSLDALPPPPSCPEDVVCLRLNGGLGTSMGLSGPKALLPVRGERTFLDVLVDQAHATGQSLALMDSFHTMRATGRALAERSVDLPRFVQHRVPRLDPTTLQPVDLGTASWAPPGHGDFFLALQTRGVIDRWIDQGMRTVFVANVDNVGARFDARIPAWMRAQGLPMVMEVTRRTAADRKGGHLVRRSGRYGLRETAQVAPGERHHFKNIQRHQWFNTNNLWFDLVLLRRALRACDGLPPLPVFTNPKTVLGRSIVQLESALGSSLGWLEGATPLAVDRDRFCPVKTTGDLLRVRSDATEVASDGSLRSVGPPPVVQLDPRHYQTVEDLDRHFPHGPPSLRDCTRIELQGPVTFEAGVVCEGEVVIATDTPLVVQAGTRLGGVLQAA